MFCSIKDDSDLINQGYITLDYDGLIRCRIFKIFHISLNIKSEYLNIF